MIPQRKIPALKLSKYKKEKNNNNSTMWVSKNNEGLVRRLLLR